MLQRRILERIGSECLTDRSSRASFLYNCVPNESSSQRTDSCSPSAHSIETWKLPSRTGIADNNVVARSAAAPASTRVPFAHRKRHIYTIYPYNSFTWSSTLYCHVTYSPSWSAYTSLSFAMCIYRADPTNTFTKCLLNMEEHDITQQDGNCSIDTRWSIQHSSILIARRGTMLSLVPNSTRCTL